MRLVVWLAVMALAVVPGAVWAQDGGVEQEMFDALQKYCMATNGRTEDVIAAAEQDGWLPASGSRSGAGRFMTSPHADPMALGVEFSSGGEAGFPLYICHIQAAQGRLDAGLAIVQTWMPGSQVISPPSVSANIFGYLIEANGLEVIDSSTPEEELRSAVSAGRVIFLIVEQDEDSFQFGLMIPAR